MRKELNWEDKYIPLFDSHSHISLASNWIDYPSLDVLIEHSKLSGIKYIVDSAVSLESVNTILQTYTQHPDIIIPTIGVHPEILITGTDIYREDFDIQKSITDIRCLLSKTQVFRAVGECGLDYFHLINLSGDKIRQSVREKEMRLFEGMIAIATENKLPLIVHSRNAEEETFSMIRKLVGNTIDVLFHSFTGSIDLARNITESGYYISFNGILTYKHSDDVKSSFVDLWKNYPNRILVETDAPFLSPQQVRKYACEPSFVKYVIKEMALLTAESIETIGDVLYRNSIRFFRISL